MDDLLVQELAVEHRARRHLGNGRGNQVRQKGSKNPTRSSLNHHLALSAEEQPATHPIRLTPRAVRRAQARSQGADNRHKLDRDRRVRRRVPTSLTARGARMKWSIDFSPVFWLLAAALPRVTTFSSVEVAEN